MPDIEVLTNADHRLGAGVINVQQVDIAVFGDNSFEHIGVGNQAPGIVLACLFHHQRLQRMLLHL